jgi:hypothetical protein
MNGLMNFIKDNFSAFVEAMFFIPSEIQIQYVGVGGVAVLVFVLVVALAAIFLAARRMRKHNLRFTASVLFTFLVLSLTLGLTGFFLSIPRLRDGVSYTFPIVCIGSPVFNLVLGVVASWGHRLRNNRPLAGTFLLFGAGILFAYVLFTTILLFAFRLYN